MRVNAARYPLLIRSISSSRLSWEVNREEQNRKVPIRGLERQLWHHLTDITKSVIFEIVATNCTSAKQNAVWKSSFRDILRTLLICAVLNHFTNCDRVNYLLNLNNLFDNLHDSPGTSLDSALTFCNLIINNFQILHFCKNNSMDQLLLLLQLAHYPTKDSGKGLSLLRAPNIPPGKAATDHVHFRDLVGKGNFTIKMDFKKHPLG